MGLAGFCSGYEQYKRFEIEVEMETNNNLVNENRCLKRDNVELKRKNDILEFKKEKENEYIISHYIKKSIVSK